MRDTNAIDRMFDGIAKGDTTAALAACTASARFWHSFDRVAHDRDSIAKDWAGLIAGTAARGVTDVKRQATPDGFVQQHLFFVRTASGEQRVWPVCVVVRIEGGLIARFDEYIDRAGSYVTAEKTLETPGF